MGGGADADDARSVRVLCVDDEPELAATIAGYLERSDERFVAAAETRPAAALERVERGRVDGVVSDLRMPRLDGLELCRRVREVRPDLPFVLLTARPSESVAADAEAVGVDACLRKGSGTDTYDALVEVFRREAAEDGDTPRDRT